jgi:hypothetical protein
LSEQALIIKAGMSSASTDFDGPRVSRILETPDSEIGANDKNSDENERKRHAHGRTDEKHQSDSNWSPPGHNVRKNRYRFTQLVRLRKV